MSGSGGADPYLDPASGVLRNLPGITDAGELAQVEAALSGSRLVDLERRRLPGSYDLDHLRAFHACVLGDLYDWAGELRTVSIAKGSVFWVRMDPDRNNAASAAAHRGDLGPMTAMLGDLIDLPHPPGPPGPGGWQAA